ncbi:M20 family peptidase [Bacteroidota bacterium]
MVKKIIKILTAGIIILLLVIIVKTLLLKSRQIEVEPIEKLTISQHSINNLSEAIRIKTISNTDNSKVNWQEFDKFIGFIEKKYPKVDSILQKKIINNYSFLYKWEGRNSNLKPVVLIAHYDVVPVEEGSLSEWEVNPFSGKIDDGFIWGRGSMDNKISMIGILEATEILLKEGYSPERTIYFGFGHDEEVLGQAGGLQIAKYLESINVEAEFVLDEGMVIVRNQVPGIKKDVALIGLSEKGFMTVELSVNMESGHSSMPPEETAIGVMSRAIVNLRDKQPKARISDPIRGFFDYLGPEMSFGFRAVFANSWLFKKIILNIYQSKPASNALVQTTTSPTIFNSGIKDNVLPIEAKAIVNFRILPGETSVEVLEHIKKVVNDERILIKTISNISEPSPVSPISTSGFKTIEKTIKQVFPLTLVSPSLINSASDSRHYSGITDNIYRFLPYIAQVEDLGRFHGVNERLSIEAFKDCIRFYYQLIKNSSVSSSLALM